MSRTLAILARSGINPLRVGSVFAAMSPMEIIATKTATDTQRLKNKKRKRQRGGGASPSHDDAAEHPHPPRKRGKRTAAETDSGCHQNTDTRGKTSHLRLDALLTDPGWRQALQAEMEKSYFQELQDRLALDYSSAKEIFPPKHLIFSALNMTPLQKVKAVILGQDPYHDDRQAMGLAFSVPKEFKVPGSLRNIYKELASDISGFQIPQHGCLESWAKEGVLLLNATLSVEAHKPNSHKNYGWQTFTDEIIRLVSREQNRVVFLLWGKIAHKKEKLIDVKKHAVLKSAHPSPLTCGKFVNCKCFSKANEALKAADLKPINWNLI